MENQGRRGKRLCIAASRCCRHGAPICTQHFAAAAGPRCFSMANTGTAKRFNTYTDSNQMVYIACCVCSHSHPRRCPPPSRANSRDPTYTQIAELRVWLRLWLWLWPPDQISRPAHARQCFSMANTGTAKRFNTYTLCCGVPQSACMLRGYAHVCVRILR